MRQLRNLFETPWFHACLLTAVIALVFVRTTIFPLDDHYLYQKFIESLAAGNIDLSIPGFHGPSFLALPLYLITRSSIANIQFQILCALFLVPAGMLAAQSLLRDRFQVILFTYTVALMPFLFFFAFRGFTFPSYTLMLFLTLWLRGLGSRWAWLPWSISMLIKPFTAAFLPLFLLWSPTGKKTGKQDWIQIGLAAVLPLLYFGAQYFQIGRIIIGAHENIDHSNVFQWMRLPLNAAHGIQMFFSIHNFYYPDPARTSLGNMLHSSPLLMLLGVVSFLYIKRFWNDHRLGFALALSAALAFLMAMALDHADQFYVETAVILLALGSIPVLVQYRRLLPLVLATFHFQFFYLYLQYKDVFFTDKSLFWIVGVVDVLALLSLGIFGWWRWWGKD